MINNKVKDPSAARRIRLIAGIAALAVAAIILVASCCVVVPAGHSGVVMTLGKVSDQVLAEGFHFKAPFVQQVEMISNKIQKKEVAANAVSKDLQTVNSNVAVNFRVSNASSASVFQNIGRGYEDVVLLPAVQESMKSVSAKYTAEELITKREAVSEETKDTLESKVQEYGIIIEKFNIVNFDFTDEFNAAIEAKQVAEQNLIKTRTEQEEQIVIANAEAEKKRIAAQADSDSAIIAAKAEAERIRIEAEATAEANRIITESLNESVLKYKTIEKWDGQLPRVSLGEGAAPLIEVPVE